MYTPKKTTQHISKIETLFVPNLAHLPLAQDQGARRSLPTSLDVHLFFIFALSELEGDREIKLH